MCKTQDMANGSNPEIKQQSKFIFTFKIITSMFF